MSPVRITIAELFAVHASDRTAAPGARPWNESGERLFRSMDFDGHRGSNPVNSRSELACSVK
jgi:hypothetical protein